MDTKQTRLLRETHEFDVCVVGGGMAGLCAAVASARNGARTALVQDRPVLGGNASSEIRMWICGAHGKQNKETGILEEIQLENLYRNPSLNYSIWDGVLYGKAAFQPGLTPFLNCSCTGAAMDGDRVAEIDAWQLTSQTRHAIRARYFIDCSGDSILAAVTPAEFRVGRESRAEFGESIEPAEADRRTMGNSLLIQVRRTDEPQPFTPPRWAYRFDGPEDLPHRINGVSTHNFWWIEVGGLRDTIRDAERIGGELMKVAYGVWDYIKNRAPERERAANWALEWLGALPGKRENRRFVGEYILTENDVRAGGQFRDIVAYGGWSMDDHHPAGIFYPGPPTIFHPAPSPYGIPFRSLYSRNVPNLLFAGRNISVTHAALSSTRVMGTCAIVGQAAGTAAALSARHGCIPRELSSGDRLAELQSTLMDDDCWLPGIARRPADLARSAEIRADAGDASRLVDGAERDAEKHAWVAPVGSAAGFCFGEPAEIAGARLVFDSDLANEKRMPCSYPQNGNRCLVPSTLVKAFRIEALDDGGNWRTVYRDACNYQRLAMVPFTAKTRGIRIVPEETWGDETARVFAFEPLALFDARIPAAPEGRQFRDAVAKIAPKDLAPPESGLDSETRRTRSA